MLGYVQVSKNFILGKKCRINPASFGHDLILEFRSCSERAAETAAALGAQTHLGCAPL